MFWAESLCKLSITTWAHKNTKGLKSKFPKPYCQLGFIHLRNRVCENQSNAPSSTPANPQSSITHLKVLFEPIDTRALVHTHRYIYIYIYIRLLLCSDEFEYLFRVEFDIFKEWESWGRRQGSSQRRILSLCSKERDSSSLCSKGELLKVKLFSVILFDK